MINSAVESKFLSKEEVAALVCEVKDDCNSKAFSKLLKNFSGFIYSEGEASGFNMKDDYINDEVMTAGAVGLFNSIQRYNPSKNDNFMVCLKFGLKDAFYEHVRKSEKNIYLPKSVYDSVRKVTKVFNTLSDDLSRDKKVAATAAASGLSLQDTAEFLSYNYESTSLYVRNEDGEECSVLDFCPETGHSDVESDFDVQEAKREVRAMLSKLPADDRFIITHAYGIGCEKLTYGEIGEALGGLSRQNIQQRKLAIERRLRTSPLSDSLRDYNFAA